MRTPVNAQLREAAFVQARLLDRFIALACDEQERCDGFTRDSLDDLIETLRDERRALGDFVRPQLVAVPKAA